MSKMSELDVRIEEILNQFNFKRVRDTMEYLGLDWEGALPSVVDLMLEARTVLEQSVEYGYVASGGFIARYEQDRFSLVYAIDEVDESYEM